MDENEYLEIQHTLCKKHSKNTDLVGLNFMIAISRDFNPKIQINGLRHPTTKLSGWYIWSGKDFDTTEVNYFQPSHVYHLLEHAEFVVKYLGLPKGSRFLIDKTGYEDIWYDEDLLDV